MAGIPSLQSPAASERRPRFHGSRSHHHANRGATSCVLGGDNRGVDARPDSAGLLSSAPSSRRFEGGAALRWSGGSGRSPIPGFVETMLRPFVTLSARGRDIHSDVRDHCERHGCGTTVRPLLGGRVRGWVRETRTAGAIRSGRGSKPGMTSVAGAHLSPAARVWPRLTAVGAALAVIAWGLMERAAAVPVVVIAALSLLAAVVDARSHRIPNQLILGGLFALVAGGAVTAVGDHRGLIDVGGALFAGFVLSGAPLLGVMWLVRPATVGAGDVKLLTLQGAAIGLVAPLAAPIVLLIAGVTALGQSLVGGPRRAVPLGPGLAVGFVGAVVAGVTARVVFGGTYW